MSDNAGKPRVLLSILKGENFEAFGDGSDLCTAIIAGFGRFECERVLKPSGVELMNLSHSANIDISVLKKDRETGKKEPLLRGYIPLGTLHSAFFSQGGDTGEYQTWEDWMGLFDASVSLKGYSPERIFQQCLDMGKAARDPRLYIRLQYLQPGANAGPKAPPTSVSPTMEMSMRGQLNMQNVHNSQTKPFGSGMAVSGTSPQARFSASEQEDRRPLPPTSGIPRESAGNATGPSWLRSSPGGHTPGVGTGRQSSVEGISTMERIGPPARAYEVQATANIRTASPQVPQVPHGHGDPNSTSNMGRNSAPNRGISMPSPPQWHRQRSGSMEGGESAAAVASWRAKCEELERAKVAAQEKIAVLEKALKQATEKQQALQQEQMSQTQLQTVEVSELRQMVASLRINKEEIEQENARLHNQDGAREDAALNFFEQVAPSLSGLGRPLRVQPAEAVATPESMQAHLTQVANTLADALVEKSSGGTTQETLPQEEVGFFGEAVEQAAEGSEAFDAWLSRKQGAQSRLAKAGSFISACTKVAQLKDTFKNSPVITEASEALPIAVAPFYAPVKTDPVDLYIASNLLRFATDPSTASAATSAAAGLLRLEPGKYRLGPDGPRLHCSIDECGQVMVQVPSGNSNEAQSDPVELGDFLRKLTSESSEMKAT